MTTEELIARLTELEAKATPGPWVTAADAGCTNHLYKGLIADLGNDLTNKWRAVVKDGDYLVVNDELATNADLIVALRNDALPGLKALAAENAELRANLLALKSGTSLAGEIYREQHKALQARLADATALLERAAEALKKAAWQASIKPSVRHEAENTEVEIRAFLDAQKEAK